MLKTLRKPPRKAVSVGPEDHGRRMSLDDFDRAVAREGFVYELNKGVIEVSNVPQPKHGQQLRALRNQLGTYDDTHPGVIHDLEFFAFYSLPEIFELGASAQQQVVRFVFGNDDGVPFGGQFCHGVQFGCV